MKDKRALVRWYVLAALLFGILGFIDTIIAYFSTGAISYFYIASLLFLFFFLANIFFLFYFIHNRLAKIFYVLPAYHIAAYIILSVAGAIVIFKEFSHPSISITFSLIALITSIFEIFFSLYLLKKYLLVTED